MWDRQLWVVLTATPIVLLEIAMITWAAYTTEAVIPFLNKTGPCFPVGTNVRALSYYAPVIWLDLQLTALVLWRCHQMQPARTGRSNLNKLVRFIRGQAAGYYLVICVTAAVNL